MTTQFLYVSCARCRGSTQLQSSSNGASWVQATTAAFVQKILSALLRPMMHEMWNHNLYQTDLKKKYCKYIFCIILFYMYTGLKKAVYPTILCTTRKTTGRSWAPVSDGCNSASLQAEGPLSSRFEFEVQRHKPPFNPESIHPFWVEVYDFRLKAVFFLHKQHLPNQWHVFLCSWMVLETWVCGS